MRTTIYGATTLWLGLILSSCGGASASAEGASTTAAPAASAPNVWESDITAVFPANTVLVARLNIDSLRGWSAWPRALSILDTLRRRDQAFDDAQWSAISQHGHEFALGGSFDEANRHDEALAIVRMDSPVVALGDTPVTERFGFRSTVNSARDYGAAVLDSRTAFFVGDDRIDAELQRLKAGDFASVWTNAPMRDVRDALNGEQAALTAQLIPPGPVRLALFVVGSDELRFDEATAHALAEARAFSARVDVGQDLHANGFIDASSPAAAALLATGFQSLVRGYASNIAMSLMGLTPILNRVTITANASRVSIQVTLTAAEADSLLTRASLILGD
ncbi:MAG: hypothetical protein IPK60_02205 [Sandaracinaceae bacterium]|nr:hypothetical protein [Sandaracinaceae bacterium]